MDAANEDASARLARLADRVEIMEVLARYCRGVDRCDEATLAGVYHPDALDDHGTFTGPAQEFAAWAVAGARTFWHSSHHTVHNVMIDWLDVDAARVESYVLGVNRRVDAPAEGSQGGGHGPIEVFAGRYLDRFERRDGVWKIADRRALRDVDTLLERRGWAGRIPEGGRHPDDPTYRTDR
jgi:hypothetical protein